MGDGADQLVGFLQLLRSLGLGRIGLDNPIDQSRIGLGQGIGLLGAGGEQESGGTGEASFFIILPHQRANGAEGCA